MELTIIQQILLGIIQGITEWLPISSSGFTILFMSSVLNITNFDFLIHTSLFLHLGTFLAALIYFRKDVWNLLKSITKYKNSQEETQKILKFLIIATLISGAIGILILQLLYHYESELAVTGRTITGFIAILLLFTGFIQLKKKKMGLRQESNLKTKDGILLGIAQGFSSLPGISRSGITISSLMLRNFNDPSALRLSFLMSLPIVLAGNILLNLNGFTLTSAAIYGLIASFIFGLLTIHAMITISKRINFGWFALVFGLLMLGSLLI